VRALLVASLICACSSPRETPQPGPIPLFGDDRVADVLGRDPARAPRTFAEHEALFGVGRACSRTDSHEIFVIEERATRFAEVIVPTTTIAPRVIVSGCSPAPQSLDGVAVSFGMFTVMPTDPSRDARDPLAVTPIEVMALDRRTGTYGFYVFDEQGVQRIVRTETGVVRTVVGKRDGSVEELASKGPRCFGCHVQGGPLMASLGDPWTSWVSTRTEVAVGSYEGETAAIVAESNMLDRSVRRAAFANALEGIVRNAIRAFVVGGAEPGSGLVARTLGGAEPGGLPHLLRSVFCETELQFASTFETVPLQLFVDPAAVVGADITRPIAAPGDDFPQLLPIRSEMDLRIEEQLVTRGVLSRATVQAIRLLDDERDVFSEKRCSLLPRVIEALPVDPRAVDAYVREVVRDALPADAAFARALLDGREDPGARDAYFAAVGQRFADAVASFTADRAMWVDRLMERRQRARAMFPGDAHPLPFAATLP
jgi:hypothetical protein